MITPEVEWREIAGCDNGCQRHPHCTECGREFGCTEEDVFYEKESDEYADECYCSNCGALLLGFC